jgi:hypothetical protein
LRWLINVDSDVADLARAELERRGTTIDAVVEVSGHAIDRASLSPIRGVWKDDRLPGEGLHAWLTRVATEAFDGTEEATHKDIKFAFALGAVYPTLKTVVYKGEVQKEVA